MPKRPQLSCDDLYNLFKSWNFLKDGKYLPYNDRIWQDASHVTDNKMSKDHIYQCITQNRGMINKNSVTGLSYRIHGEQLPKIPKKSKKCNKDQLNWSMKVPKKHHKDLQDLRQNIHLSCKEWNKLGIQLKEYKERTYEVLEPGWCDKVYYTIYENLKLPCAFSFKNAKIDRTTGGPFLTIKGQCTQCNTEIHLYSLTEPTADGIDFHISTLDTREIIHTKKRQLRGDRRRQVAEELKGKSAYLWQREAAHKRMDFGDNIPADLYSSEVLRKVMQETIEKELGLKSGENPILSLFKLAQSPEYAGSIRAISLHKAFIMYWLPEQITLYNLFLKNDKVGAISIDATGSLTKPLPTADGSKSIIYLYQAVTGYNGKILPLFQMISEKHDANTLCYWIREWLRSGAKIPKEIIIDYSRALLIACSLAFNQCGLQEYLDECFRQIFSSDTYLKRMCLLRIDIAHLIKMITRWPCFSKDLSHVKDFFIRCVALLTLQTDVKKFENLLLVVLIVAYSSRIDENNDTDLCFKSREELLNLMKTGLDTWTLNDDDSRDDIFVKVNDLNRDTDENYENDNRRPIINFIKNIEKKCQENTTSTGVPNKYMCISFGKKLIELSKEFVLWTHIMPNLYRKNKYHETDDIERASSTRSEEYFKDVKNFILQKKKLRVDKVVIQHLKVLSGTVNLLAPNKHVSNLPNSDDSSQERINDEIVNTSQDTSAQFLDTVESRILESSNLKTNITESLLNNSSNFQNSSFLNMNDIIENSEDNQGECQNKIFPSNTKIIIESSTNNTDVSLAKNDKSTIDNFTNIEDSCKEISKGNFTLDKSLMNYTQSSCKNDFPKNSVNDLLLSDISPIGQVNKKRFLLSETESSPSILDDSNYNINQSTELKNPPDEHTAVTDVLQDISSNRENSYLNKVDEWKGLTNNKKRKAVYFEYYPDIENLHKRPKLTKKISLMINGNSKPPLQTSAGLLKFSNTCPFDSIIHCVRVGYTDWAPYNEYVNRSNNKVFDIIKVLSTKGAINYVYKARAEILLKFKKPKGNIVNCKSNIGNIINEIFHDEPSITMTRICNVCKDSKTWIKSAFEVALSPLYKKGLKGLQESLNNYCQHELQTCKTCNEQKTVIFDYGSHLFVDFEALQWTILAKRSGYSSDYERKFSLEDLPGDLYFGDYIYKLVGAIEHIPAPAKSEDTVAHYQSLILRNRNKLGSWELHDGLSPTAKPRKLNKREKKQKRCIHVLFYIKSDKTHASV